MTPLMLADSLETMLIPLVAITGGILIAIIGMITAVTRSIMRSKHQEDSRREIAAYVAEGSISSDDAAKILRAGHRKWDKWGASDVS